MTVWETKQVMWFGFNWTNLSLTTLSFFLHQIRQKCMQFRSYTTFSLFNTSPFCSAGNSEGRHGQTTDNWHKSTFTARCPPSQGLHKYITQDGTICFIITISRHYFLHYLDSMILLSREMRCSGLQALTTSPGLSHFDFIGMPEANIRRFRTWRNEKPDS